VDNVGLDVAETIIFSIKPSIFEAYSSSTPAPLPTLQSLSLPGWSLHQANEEAGENHAFGSLAGDEFLIRLGATLETVDEFLDGVVDRVFGGETEAIGVERAIFFARKVIGFVGWEAVQVTGKKMSLSRGVEFVANKEALGQQQISSRGDDGGEQNADAFFALVEKMLERFQRQREVSG
jgi:hypothetical protein